MDEICMCCKKPLAGTQVVKVVDGTMSADGEFDPQNTETYHSECVVIDW